MNPLRRALGQYLIVRRALGYRLLRQGKALESFVSFAECERVTVITTDLARRWAQLPERVDPATWTGRLGTVRQFARYCYSVDPRTEIPPTGLLPHRFRRKPPYLWSRAEIEALLVAARAIPSPLGLRSLTYETLFGLLSATGLRINEALHLHRDDIDWTTGILTIRHAKFGKTRYVPLHRSTVQALHRYAEARDRLAPARGQASYFITEQGARLSESAVRHIFARLLTTVPYERRPGRRRPRIHDLRHVFAVETLRRWYHDGRDVEAWLPRLATYLGHVHVNDTYWYLTAVPDLLAAAARRLESRQT